MHGHAGGRRGHIQIGWCCTPCRFDEGDKVVSKWGTRICGAIAYLKSLELWRRHGVLSPLDGDDVIPSFLDTPD